MKKRKSFIKLLLIVLLALTFVMFAACNPTDDKSDTTDPETPAQELTEGLLISNSDFKVKTGENFPKSPSQWTGAAFSKTAYPQSVITGVIDVDSAVYDENKSKWGNLANPGKKGTPTDNDELMIYMPTSDTESDDEEIEYGATAYGYTSPSFTISKGYYYELTVDVKTLDIAGGKNAGARIYIASTAYSEFKSIDTKGQWETYKIYIEGPKDADKTLTLNLSLGHYTSADPADFLTTGYVFFDNVALEKIQKTQTKSAKQIYDEADGTQELVNKLTYTVPNGEFDYGTMVSSSSSATPSLWSISTGNANSDYAAPTSYRYNGIVDTATFDANKSKLGTTVYRVSDTADGEGKFAVNAVSSVEGLTNPETPTGAQGTKVYMLSQIYMTAQYIYSSTPLVIEKGKYYNITVPVYTTGIFGEGVTIKLKGNGADISFTGISKTLYDTQPILDDDGVEIGQEEVETGTGGTTGGWKNYTFTIKGNSFRDLSYTLELWLGTGDTSDNTSKEITRYTATSNDAATTTKKTTLTSYTSDGTFAKGWAFFDSIKLTEITASVYNGMDGIPEESIIDGEVEVEGAQDMRVSLDQDSYFTSFEGKFTAYTDDANNPYDNNTLGTPQDFSTTFDKDTNNTKIDGVSLSSTTRAGVVDTSDNDYFTSFGVANPKVPYEFGSTNVLMLSNTASQLYKIDTASFEIIQNTAYRVSVWVKTADIKSTSGAFVYLLDQDEKTLVSSSAINTAEYENEFTNDWIEYLFIVRGYSDKDLTASLRLAIGSGDRWSTTTLTQGTAFFANINCVEITETEYTQLASVTTNSKSTSYGTKESDLLIYNRAFDLYNLEKTKGLVNGELFDELGVPLNYTISSSTTDAKSGIGKFNTADGLKFTIDGGSQLANLGYSSEVVGTAGKLGGTEWSIYDNWPTDSDDALDNLSGGPSALIIDGTSEGGFALGYTSDKISLPKVSIYAISVWVRTVGIDVTYSLYLIGENGSTTAFDQENYIQTKTSDNAWTKHTFFVEVGLIATSVQLGLWMGTNSEVTDEVKSEGIVVFDSLFYTQITDEEFDALTKDDNNRKLSFLSDGFDSVGNEIGAKSGLPQPEGWTGDVVTGGNTTDSAKGVIYVYDLGNYIKPEEFFGIRKPSDYDDLTPEEQAEIDAQIEASLIPNSALTPMANGGNRFLIINNKQPTGYYFKGASYTLSAETYFRISVWAKTYAIEEDKGAYIEIDAKDNNKEFTNINHDEWTEYVFFIKTADADIANVTLTLGLGKEAESETDTGNLLTGYAMFDNVTFGIMTETEFENIDKDSVLFTSGRAHIIEMPESPADIDDDEKPAEQPAFKPDLTYLWWMIPTILIAVALIAVIITVLVKKVYKPRKQKAEEASYSKDAKTSDALDVKKEEYDKFKE